VRTPQLTLAHARLSLMPWVGADVRSGTRGKNEREVRLRPEYAAWYPAISVAIWIPAPTVARAVARQLVGPEPSRGPRWAPGARLLDEHHFLFRGGASRDGPHPLTRRGDGPQKPIRQPRALDGPD
jgi:hypothetical protein